MQEPPKNRRKVLSCRGTVVHFSLRVAFHCCIFHAGSPLLQRWPHFWIRSKELLICMAYDATPLDEKERRLAKGRPPVQNTKPPFLPGCPLSSILFVWLAWPAIAPSRLLACSAKLARGPVEKLENALFWQPRATNEQLRNSSAIHVHENWPPSFEVSHPGCGYVLLPLWKEKHFRDSLGPNKGQVRLQAGAENSRRQVECFVCFPALFCFAWGLSLGRSFFLFSASFSPGCPYLGAFPP